MPTTAPSSAEDQRAGGQMIEPPCAPLATLDDKRILGPSSLEPLTDVGAYYVVISIVSRDVFSSFHSYFRRVKQVSTFSPTPLHLQQIQRRLMTPNLIPPCRSFNHYRRSQPWKELRIYQSLMSVEKPFLSRASIGPTTAGARRS